MLNIKSLFAGYGAIEALHGLSLHVNPGELVVLLGANGAGKSTLLSCISGLLGDWRGDITLGNQEIPHGKPESSVAMGITLVPEKRELFPQMSVYEHLTLGAFHRSRGPARKRIKDDMERIYRLFPVLDERKEQPAGTLSGGQQQMLAIGRALMSAPRLLLLDEPSLGLAPLVIREIFDAIAFLKEQGMTILLVEQNARLALKYANRGYVLENGRLILQGTAEELSADTEIKRAYLGKNTKGFLA
ncbi:MAG: ABC transporter ATP-binding protein [Bacillota bacterium]